MKAGLVSTSSCGSTEQEQKAQRPLALPAPFAACSFPLVTSPVEVHSVQPKNQYGHIFPTESQAVTSAALCGVQFLRSFQMQMSRLPIQVTRGASRTRGAGGLHLAVLPPQTLAATFS